MHTNSYNELNQLTEDKTMYDFSNKDKIYSSKYRYDKDGKLISSQRFKNGVQINLNEKNTVFSDKKEFDKIGNLIKKTVYENSKVMLTEEYKFKYYS